MLKNCLLCGNEKYKIVFQEFDVDIVRCTRCRHVYSLYEQAVDYEGYFDEEELTHVDQFWWDQAHQAMYEDFAMKFMKESGGRLLDVGCGLGFSVRYFSQYLNWDVMGCEISAKAVEFARTQLGLSQVYCGRIQDQEWPDSSFDLITLWDVLEHLPEPKEVLATLTKLLKPEGLIFIHTPNIQLQLPKARLKKYIRGMHQHIHYLEARDHIHIYSPGSLKRLLEQTGFRDIEFLHLKPIQSVSGSKSNLLTCLKNSCFKGAKLLYRMSYGQINFDNLFVTARKL